MVPSNVRKNKGTTECEKNIITCDVSTTQYEDDTIKCEKKIKELPNVTKLQSHVMLVLHNVQMISSNVRKKIKKLTNVTKVSLNVMLVQHNVMMVLSNVRKSKGTVEFDKSTITCDVSTTQCENGTINFDVLVT